MKAVISKVRPEYRAPTELGTAGVPEMVDEVIHTLDTKDDKVMAAFLRGVADQLDPPAKPIFQHRGGN